MWLASLFRAAVVLSFVLQCWADLEELEPYVGWSLHNSIVWRCHHPGTTSLQYVQQNGHALQLEVLSIRSNWIELTASTNSTEVLDSYGLFGCEQIAQLSDLIASELAENWPSLRHHVSHLYHHSLDDSAQRNLRKRSACDDETCKHWFGRYHNLSEIYHWYHTLADQYSSRVTLNSSIGQTYYGRDIIAVHITDTTVNTRKPKVYFQCLLHPREWISGSVCMYIAQEIASASTSDLMLANLLKQVEFVIVPVANPDGYYLTWLQYPKYRLWRKNASPQNGSQCAGVDLNRNFDAHWNQASSSSDPCSELYQGTHAASELEIQAITTYIQRSRPLLGAIDFHSYHQEILYPPAWSNDVVPELDTLDYVAKWVTAAANQIGKKYTSRSMNSVYLASGTFPDWLLEHGRQGSQHEESCIIPLTAELRPEPHPESPYSGFMLPTSEILPTCQEMMPAVMKFSQLVYEKRANCYNLL